MASYIAPLEETQLDPKSYSRFGGQSGLPKGTCRGFQWLPAASKALQLWCTAATQILRPCKEARTNWGTRLGRPLGSLKISPYWFYRDPFIPIESLKANQVDTGSTSRPAGTGEAAASLRAQAGPKHRLHKTRPSSSGLWPPGGEP